MKGISTALLLIVSCGTVNLQKLSERAEMAPAAPNTTLQVLVEGQSQSPPPLQSNRNFPDFIGFMRNPLQAIDVHPSRPDVDEEQHEHFDDAVRGPDLLREEVAGPQSLCMTLEEFAPYLR